ncbi:MAG: hypothetical protein ABSG02_11370 [Terriglobales bacterium]|jgi:hypothetical protein
MKTQVTIMERRQYQRGQGVLAQIENLTYNVLRKYGINGSAAELNPGTLPEKAA